MLAIFLDPNADEGGELRAHDLPPRLHFENPSLKQSMLKLKAVMISSLEHEQTYAEHVGLIILYELGDALLGKREAQAFKGGLTARQFNHVRDYITANLDKDISLSVLAGSGQSKSVPFYSRVQKNNRNSALSVRNCQPSRTRQGAACRAKLFNCCCGKIGWLSQHTATRQGVPPSRRHDALVLSRPSCRQPV